MGERKRGEGGGERGGEVGRDCMMDPTGSQTAVNQTFSPKKVLKNQKRLGPAAICGRSKQKLHSRAQPRPRAINPFVAFSPPQQTFRHAHILSNSPSDHPRACCGCHASRWRAIGLVAKQNAEYLNTELIQSMVNTNAYASPTESPARINKQNAIDCIPAACKW